MKWALAQLKKIDKPLTIDATIDFSEEIKNIDDIIRMSPVHVTGTGYELSEDEYVFSLDIKAELVLECAITLEEVPYSLNLHSDEVFARENKEDEDINLIDGETIDLVPVVFSNIIVNKPIRVVKEGAIYESEEEDEKINPAFADLKDFYKD